MATTHHVRRNTHRKHNGHAKILKDDTQELFRYAVKEMKEKSENAREAVTDYIKKKPLQSLGIALVAGAVLSFLIRR